MLERVLAVRGDRPAPASLSLVLLGGGPASADLIRRAISLGYPVAPTYGLTEAASQVATRPPRPGVRALTEEETAAADPAARLQPLPGVELRIVDARGRPCAVGEEGEIRVRGPIVMAGYLDDPAATERALDAGWLATGDIGRLAEDGTLRVLDRRADLIVSGGENVYPAEIESLLESHPDVAEAGVVGVPDERFGARPVALVVPRANAPVACEALEALCRAKLAGYKQPRAILAVDSLPRTATGKLRRRDLAALYASRATSVAPGSSPHGG
jgi:O-succinylbenzoic acid--CoA ligase